jgi:hypothetical protein
VVGLQRVLWSKEFLALITTISASTTHFGLSNLFNPFSDTVESCLPPM